MSYVDILAHDLIAVDAAARWCACGARFTLEHLGEVALTALDAPPTAEAAREAERAAHRERRRLAREDALWLVERRRLANLATFQHMTEVWAA